MTTIHDLLHEEETGELVILRGFRDGYAVYDVRQPDGSFARRIAGMTEENYAKAKSEKEGDAR